MIAGCDVINLRDVARGWEQAEREAAHQARAEVKLHSPLADLLLGALFQRREKIGDVVRDLVENTDSPDDLALLLIELSLAMYGACYLGNWECD
jgi:hypothetical protein